MKKILLVILCVTLVFTLVGCDKQTKKTPSDNGDINVNGDTFTDGSLDNTEDLFESDETEIDISAPSQNDAPLSPGSAEEGTDADKPAQNTPSSGDDSPSFDSDSSKKPEQNTPSFEVESVPDDSPAADGGADKTEPDNGGTPSDDAYGDVDNGILQSVTFQKMNVPENMELSGKNGAAEDNNSKNKKVTVVMYQLDGEVAGWVVENNLLYVITAGNNRLVVIDEKTMKPLANVPLSGKPAEIDIADDGIYVSLPELCRIDVFSKSELSKISSLTFEHQISSFCVDGNTVYYSEHDQHCKVYRKNMTTGELADITAGKVTMFYMPKLYLNKQDNILYIGESGSSGSALYYFDATTLELKSVFEKDNYGITNHTRDIFHVGDNIFWGNYRLSDTDANNVIGKYGEASYGSVNFASKDLVATFEGIFLTDSYECIVNFLKAQFKYEYVLASDSYNYFFRSRYTDKNIILGVNFSMQ